MVCAVVCTAPLTMPSAIPRCTIMVPKYETSVTVSVATCSVMPLCARSRAYSLAKVRDQFRVVRATRCARPADVDAERQRLRPDDPSRRRAGSGRRRPAAAGWRPRAGCARPRPPAAPRAGDPPWPARTAGTGTSTASPHSIRRRRSRPASATVSTVSPKSRSAVSSFTVESAVSRPRTPARVDRGLEGAGRRSPGSAGPACTPSISCCTDLAGAYPPVSTIDARFGKVAD